VVTEFIPKVTAKRFTQSQLTKIFSELSGQHPSKLVYQIWNNPKDDNSLRLSLKGYKFVVQDLQFKSYKFEFERPLANKHLLQLERLFQGVYYLIGAHKIVVFDEQEAAMLSLMDGNLKQYLSNLESNT
jgi:hypothetical protein